MANKTKPKAARPLSAAENPNPAARNGNPNRAIRLLEFLEREVWPNVPSTQLSRVLTREEEDEILGFGPDGL
jgi:antitoxin VapB